MANHCIYAACTGCGAWYCLRGCNDASGPDENNKTFVQEKVKTDGPLKYDGMLCHYCKTENLYKL
jgi:hypothetical protein